VRKAQKIGLKMSSQKTEKEKQLLETDSKIFLL
jgi:hypothetical protein